MMDWLPFPWGKKKKKTAEPFDIEKYLKTLRVSQEGLIEDENVIYVKSVNLVKDSAIADTKKEVDRGNLVILNIKDIAHTPILLNEKVSEIRDYCALGGGDICQISETKIMVVPRGVEIMYPPTQET